MKRLYLPLITIILAMSTAHAESKERLEAIEKEGLAIARPLCSEDYSCKILIDSYDEAVKDTSDASGRNITFNALALYIVQTLSPKLPQTEENKSKIARMNQLFEDHLAAE